MIHNRRYIFDLKRLHDTYGPVVRLGPSDISFATISAFDTIYGIGADKNFAISGSRRSLIVNTDVMTDVMLSSCLGNEPRNWLRPIIASTLSDLTGTCSEQMFNTAFEQGLKLHRVGHTPSTPMDLSTIHKDYMWTLGSLIACGRQPKLFSRSNFDALVDNTEYFTCFLEICFCFFDRFTVQKYQPTFQKVWWVLCRLAGINFPAFGIENDDRVTFKDNHYALLQAAAKKSKGRDIGDNYLQINSYSTKLSIYGTSDTSMNAIFYFLLKHPRCLKKVEEELLSTFRLYSDISDDRLATLPYLHACINETLRMAPPFCAGLLQRVSTGATVDGIYIPYGTGVTVDQYSLGNAEEHWQSANSFQPERWIESISRKNEKASRPFLTGIRQCPARTMVFQILRMAVGKTVYLYDMDLVNKDFDITVHSSSRLSWTAVDLQVTMRPRASGVMGYE
ncbi:heme binding [Ascochyta rabiei]|uniref:Heme binding n=1 Tax=Didymella rabiei TaxID=5454 RepID=A0A162ZU84_DIDRA|nr:heme binding [Ascochyta rabiei]